MSDHPVVALACSAGSLGALTKVLAPLPADLPAAVIVVQHMPPDTHSQLPAILGRDTATPVSWAHDVTCWRLAGCSPPRPDSTR